MRIDLEQYNNIRQLYSEGISIRTISKMLGINRATVRRYCKGEITPDDKITRQKTPTEKHKVVESLIKKYIDENKDNFIDKQKLTVAGIHRHIDKITQVSYGTVRNICKEQFAKEKEVTIPLIYEPGEVMQVDWFMLSIRYKSEIYKLPAFLAVLPYSDMFFCMLTLDMLFETFISCHIEAFKFFGGVPDRIFYDNLKAAVHKGFGQNAIEQERFKKFRIHYNFQPLFMNAAKGNEKGCVERHVQICRNLLYTPIKDVTFFEKFNNQNTASILEYTKNHTVSRQKQTIFENFQVEKEYLKSLPLKDYQFAISRETIVNNQLLVQDNTIKYSVPNKYIGKKVTILRYPLNIEIWHKGDCIAQYYRTPEKNIEIYNPRHYIETLSYKLRSIDNAAPLLKAQLTPELEEFKRKQHPKKWPRILWDIILLELSYGFEAINLELINANMNGFSSLELLKENIKANHKLIKRNKDSDLKNFQKLNEVSISNDDLSEYDSLIINNLDD